MMIRSIGYDDTECGINLRETHTSARLTEMERLERLIFETEVKASAKTAGTW